MRALLAYDERERFRGWLYRILINQCRSLARRRGRRDRWLVHDSEAAARQPGPSREHASEISDALQRALVRVEPLLREAFLLKHGEGFEYSEIATMTGASVPALKMRVKRACDAMRPALEELLHE